MNSEVSLETFIANFHLKKKKLNFSFNTTFDGSSQEGKNNICTWDTENYEDGTVILGRSERDKWKLWLFVSQVIRFCLHTLSDKLGYFRDPM